MGWLGLFRLFSVLLDLILAGRLADREKDLEIVLLPQQPDILQRRQHRPPGIARSEKLALTVLTTKLKWLSSRSNGQLGDILRLFKPETVLRWHRDLVARKWTFKRRSHGGLSECSGWFDSRPRCSPVCPTSDDVFG